MDIIQIVVAAGFAIVLFFTIIMTIRVLAKIEWKEEIKDWETLIFSVLWTLTSLLLLIFWFFANK